MGQNYIDSADFNLNHYLQGDYSFANLFHASWNPKTILKSICGVREYTKTGSLPEKEFIEQLFDNISIYDTRTRNKNFISPEQVKIGEELAAIALTKSGKIIEDSYDIQEFLILKQKAKPQKLTKVCDIYSLGAIMFKLILGRAPSPKISKYIADHRLHEAKAGSNVYEIPYFFKDFILSDDMCKIMTKLLHLDPRERYQTLDDVREDLVILKDNITQTPPILRQIIGHPILPSEDFGQRAIPKLINFKNSKMNEFSLKYLAKFVFEHRVERLSINGGYMPLHDIKTDQLQKLDL